jgi:hypothetical protein
MESAICGGRPGVRAAKQQRAVIGRPSSGPALKRKFLSGCALGGLVLAFSSSSTAAANQPRGQFGTVGLIDMPSAGMAPSGELAASAAFFENNQRYTLSFQALPWLETSFRYSGLSKFNRDFPVYFDRSFGLKIRLWDEGYLLPAVAIGTNDLVGTGYFSSEYIVATKHVGPFAATLGLGWGRMATANSFRNPLSVISSSFDDRSGEYGQGGSFNFGQYFHGPNAGVFGGVAWSTPIENLTLIAEYSSDNYVLETANGNFTPRHQFNFGASYSITDNIILGLSWLYGRSVSGTLTFALDPTVKPFQQRLGPVPPPPHVRTPEEQNWAVRTAIAQRKNAPPQVTATTSLADALWRRTDIQDVAIFGDTLHLQMPRTSPSGCTEIARSLLPHAGDIRRILINQEMSCGIPGPIAVTSRQTEAPAFHLVAAKDLVTIDASGPPARNRDSALTEIRRGAQEQSIEVVALALNGSEALLYYRNLTYMTEWDSVDRLLRVLMAKSPPEIENFRLISMSGDLPQIEFDIPRGTAERSFEQDGHLPFLRDASILMLPPMDDPILVRANRGGYPRFNWSIFPQLRQQLFDPVNPVGVQFLLGADFTLDLLPGLHLYGEGELNLFNDFNVNRPSDSVLPHVRTDFVRYFSEGKNGIGALYMQYDFRLSPETFLSFRGGYLESMFGGVGAEVLWRPKGQRWALGADLYHVQQRQFDRLFGFRSYTQTTGHLSLYYDAPWYDLTFMFRVGRYLAGDWGTTVQVTRRFASGIEIGAFATKTNVSSAQFGEGSFDKGIIIRLPLSHLMPVNTQRLFAMDLRPIQRDGGQVLAGDTQLYDRLRRTSEGDLWRQAP